MKEIINNKSVDCIESYKLCIAHVNILGRLKNSKSDNLNRTFEPLEDLK